MACQERMVNGCKYTKSLETKHFVTFSFGININIYNFNFLSSYDKIVAQCTTDF